MVAWSCPYCRRSQCECRCFNSTKVDSRIVTCEKHKWNGWPGPCPYCANLCPHCGNSKDKEELAVTLVIVFAIGSFAGGFIAILAVLTRNYM